MTPSPADPRLDRLTMTADKLPAGARAVYDLAAPDAGLIIADTHLSLTVTVDPANSAPTVTLCGFANVTFCGPADYEVWTPRPLPGCQSRTVGFADTPRTAYGLALNAVRRAAAHAEWLAAVQPAPTPEPARYTLLSDARHAAILGLSRMGCAAQVSIEGGCVLVEGGGARAVIFAGASPDGVPGDLYEVDVITPPAGGAPARLTELGRCQTAAEAARRAITGWVDAVITAACA